MVEAHKKCIICGHDFKIKGKPKPLTIMVGDVPVCESCKSAVILRMLALQVLMKIKEHS